MKNKEKLFKNIVLIINLAIFCYLSFVGINKYLYGMTYEKYIVFMIVNSLFLFMYGMFKDSEKNYKTNIMIYIFLFLLLLITFTFFLGRAPIRFYNFRFWGQYIPFHTISSQYKYASHYSFIKNIIGNCVMLIPLSFLLMIKNKKYNKIINQSLIIIPSIVIIECLQGLTHTGSFDIDDILLNYFGVTVFTFIITRFGIIDKIRKFFYTDFNLNIKLKKILFYVISVVVLIYDAMLFIR